MNVQAASPNQGRFRLSGLVQSQEAVVFALAAAMFIVMAIGLPRFLTAGNISALLFNMSIIGVLGCGMAMVVIGQGIDLSMVAILAVTSALLVQLLIGGMPLWQALLVTGCLAAALGALNGLLVAYLEIPALFATLASGLLFFGGSRVLILDTAVYYVPSTQEGLLAVAKASFLGLPVPVIIFAGIAICLHFVLRATTFGRYVYARGDNVLAARTSGVAVRPIVVVQYVIAGLCALLGGVIFTSASAAIDMQVFRSTLIFDVVLVVILGGVSLAGGRGSMLSVVAGTLLIGVLLNGMVILNINSSVQSIIKGIVLILAILLDRFLHPVDEETARQADTL